MTRRRRIIVSVVVFLLLGAIVNVAVAWGFAYALVFTNTEMRDVADSVGQMIWERHRDKSWAEQAGTTSAFVGRNAQYVWVDAGLGSSLMICEKSAGWPLRSMVGAFRSDNTSALWESDGLWSAPARTGREPAYIPLTPLWPGFAINTIFYAAILWLLWTIPFAIRRRRRIKRGLCPQCAYDLRGTSHEKCPECGTGCVTPSCPRMRASSDSAEV